MAGKVELIFGAKDVGVINTVTKVNASMKGMDKNTRDVSKSVGLSFGAMVKAGAALAVGFGAIKIAADALKSLMGNFTEAIKLGGDFDQMSTRTGVAVDSLVILSRAFENAGVSGDSVGKTINRMQKSIVDAGDGLEKPQRAFERLGIPLDEIKNLKPEDQFKLLGDAIHKMEDPAERTATAMDIFGRAGAEALTVFRDGAGGIDVAIDQLGSLPGVLARSAKAFDTIGDNIAAFKNKGVEFAVGFIEQVAPAIELVTHLLSRIDATAIGMRLGEILTGASNAMGGFSDAIDAIKLGEFSLAFKIAFESIKLQAADSINSIWKHIQATASAASALLSRLFGEDGALSIGLAALMDNIGIKLSIAIGKGLATIMRDIPGIGDSIEKSMLESVKRMELEAGHSAKVIELAVSAIPKQLQHGVKEANEEYKNTLATSKGLIDTSKMEIALFEKKVMLIKAKGKADAERLASAKSIVEAVKEESAEAQQIASYKAASAMIEAKILQAKIEGNKEEVKKLESQKKYYDALNKALADGETMQRALTMAAAAYADALGNAEGIAKRITSEKEKQLTLAEKITEEIEKAKIKNRIDPGGKLEDKIREDIAAGNFGKAQAKADRLKEMEILDDINEAFNGGGGVKKNIKDIAKGLGIDTFGKSTKDLIELVAKAAKDQKEQNDAQKIKDDEQKAKDEKDKGKPKPEDPMDVIKNIVTEIRHLVAKIEPKLPTAALGI